MTARNMGFELDEGMFKKYADPSAEVDNCGDVAYIYLPQHIVGVASVECCGWLEVSGLKGNDKTQPLVYKTLQTLMNHRCVVHEPDFASEDCMSKFPLFCVTTNDSVAKWLKENSWDDLNPFINPNTNNKCMPFYWHS